MYVENLADNERFALNDYNTGTVSAVNSYARNRWKIEGTGTSSDVVFTDGTTDPDMNPSKAFQAVPCLDVTVDAGYDQATDTRFLRQRRAGFVREADTAAAIRLYCCGDDGATFDIGLQTEYRRVTTSGLDRLTAIEERFEVGTLASDYLVIDAFANPTPGAAFKLIAIQVIKLSDISVFLPRWQLRTLAADRLRCNAYALPLIGREAATISSGGALAMEIPFPVPMRTAPSGLLVAGVTAEWRQRSSGSLFTAASPALSSVVSDTNHARVGLTGFTSPSSPANASTGALNTGFVLLHADY